MTEQIIIDRWDGQGWPITRIAQNPTGEQIARDDSDCGMAGEFDEFNKLIESRLRPEERPKVIFIDRLTN